MGIFDNINQMYNTPDMAQTMALLGMAGNIMAPLQPGEGLGGRLVGAAGGGLSSYIKQLQDIDTYNLETQQREMQNRYRELQMKKIEQEMEESGAAARFMDTPTPVKKLISEAVNLPAGSEEAGWDLAYGEPGAQPTQQREVTENVPYWQTLGDKGNLLRASIVNKVSIPSEFLADKTSIKIGDQDVEMTTKDLIKYMLGMEEQDYKRNKKIVRNRGYGKEGVYDYQGNVKEIRDIPVKPTTTGTSKKSTQNEKYIDSYMGKIFKDNGMNTKRLTAQQQEMYNKLKRDALSRANAGMNPEDAVRAATTDYNTKRSKNQPKKAASSVKAKPKVIKTPNGTAEIVE